MTRTAFKPRAGRLAACRRGGIAIMVGVLILPIIAIVGISIDVTRVWLVQSRLQTAVDASVLVLARQASTGGAAKADAEALFWSNFGRVHPGKPGGSGYLGAVADTPVVEALDTYTVQMRATATLGRTLTSLFGSGSTIVRAEASAKRMGMELALVLDITGSMDTNDNIGGLRKAATNLVNIVFGNSETRPNLFVSVVPFVASVNMGNKHTDWLAGGSFDPSKYGPPSYTGWSGCVEARSDGEQDSTDATPRAAPFKPFFWKSTYEVYKNNGTVVKGDNDWTNTTINEKEWWKKNDTVGPNMSCPQTAIVPLTIYKKDVLTAISGLRATYRGGTMANLGLQAGWFTLSPNWSGLWGTPGSPSPYDPQMQKVVVMMTDGTNWMYDWEKGAPGLVVDDKGKLISYDNQKVDTDYTAYGRLSENRLNILIPNTGNITNDSESAKSASKSKIDERTSKLCANMKASGVVIYTVVLAVNDQSTLKMWRDCATKPEYYFNSPNKDALYNAFEQIGVQLASFRMSQ